MTYKKLSELQYNREELEEEIRERMYFFDKKDNQWKESSSGKKFRYKTERLRNIKQCLIYSIEHLRTFLED